MRETPTHLGFCDSKIASSGPTHPPPPVLVPYTYFSPTTLGCTVTQQNKEISPLWGNGEKPYRNVPRCSSSRRSTAFPRRVHISPDELRSGGRIVRGGAEGLNDLRHLQHGGMHSLGVLEAEHDAGADGEGGKVAARGLVGFVVACGAHDEADPEEHAGHVAPAVG